MRLFDQKGRLFGLINIIDLLVLMLVTVGALGVYYVRFVPGRVAARRAEERGIEATVVVANVRMATVDVIKIGDRVRDSKTNAFLGEVINIDARPAEVVLQQPDGRFVESASTTRKDVYVTISGSGTVSENAITIGGSEIRIGTRIALKTNLYAVESTVMAINIK